MLKWLALLLASVSPSAWSQTFAGRAGAGFGGGVAMVAA